MMYVLHIIMYIKVMIMNTMLSAIGSNLSEKVYQLTVMRSPRFLFYLAQLFATLSILLYV